MSSSVSRPFKPIRKVGVCVCVSFSPSLCLSLSLSLSLSISLYRHTRHPRTHTHTQRYIYLCSRSTPGACRSTVQNNCGSRTSRCRSACLSICQRILYIHTSVRTLVRTYMYIYIYISYVYLCGVRSNSPKHIATSEPSIQSNLPLGSGQAWAAAPATARRTCLSASAMPTQMPSCSCFGRGRLSASMNYYPS